MNELEMFRSGLDTYEIARRTGKSEAEVYNAISRQREGITERCALHDRLSKQVRRQLIPYAGKEAS